MQEEVLASGFAYNQETFNRARRDYERMKANGTLENLTTFILVSLSHPFPMGVIYCPNPFVLAHLCMIAYHRAPLPPTKCLSVTLDTPASRMLIVGCRLFLKHLPKETNFSHYNHLSRLFTTRGTTLASYLLGQVADPFATLCPDFNPDPTPLELTTFIEEQITAHAKSSSMA